MRFRTLLARIGFLRSTSSFAPSRARLVSRLLAAVVLGFLVLLTGDSSSIRYLTTHIGERRSETLPDGTVVTLNTASEVKVSRYGAQIQVTLIRGEAIFNVPKSHEQRLLVSVGVLSIRHIGTIFSVRLSDDGRVQVIVVEGEVHLLVGRQLEVSLTEGHQATADYSGRDLHIEPRKSSPDAIRRQLSWLHGTLEFSGETLFNVTQEFNRYNQLKLYVADPQIMGLLVVAGGIPVNDPLKFCRSIASEEPTIRCERRDGPDGVPYLTLYQDLQPPEISGNAQSEQKNRRVSQ